MTKQEAAQAKQKEIYDYQRETGYENRERPLGWSTRMKFAMLNVSLPALAQFGARGITADDFAGLVKSIDGTPTIWQAGLLLRIAQQANSKDLGITDIDDYVVFQQAVSRLSMDWGTLNDEKYKEIEAKYDALVDEEPVPADQPMGQVVAFPPVGHKSGNRQEDTEDTPATDKESTE